VQQLDHGDVLSAVHLFGCPEIAARLESFQVCRQTFVAAVFDQVCFAMVSVCSQDDLLSDPVLEGVLVVRGLFVGSSFVVVGFQEHCPKQATPTQQGEVYSFAEIGSLGGVAALNLNW